MNKLTCPIFPLNDDLAVEVLFFLGGGDEKEMERRNGTDPSGF